jgi:hypothetical protein
MGPLLFGIHTLQHKWAAFRAVRIWDTLGKKGRRSQLRKQLKESEFIVEFYFLPIHCYCCLTELSQVFAILRMGSVFWQEENQRIFAFIQ